MADGASTAHTRIATHNTATNRRDRGMVLTARSVSLYAQPQRSDYKHREGDGQTHAEILPEAQVHAIRRGALDDDDVGNRPGDRQISRQRRSHRERQPSRVWVAKTGNDGS